jgi:glycosyltransferase involved in cell wall biosynthesis
MRICFITSLPLPPEEGMGYHIWNLSQRLVRAGHRVGIITRGRAAPVSAEEVDGVTVWRVPFAPIYPFHVHLHGYFVNRLLRQIEGEFDLINAHTPLPPAVNSSLPVVTTVHSPMRSDTAATIGHDLRTIALRLQTPVSQQIERSLFQRSKGITAVASWVAQALQAYGIDSARVAITGNGVEECFFDPSLNQEREPFILYVGRLQVSKGVQELIEAADIIRKRRPDLPLRVILVGKGPMLPKLQQMVEQANLHAVVTFAGHVGAESRDQLVQLYRRASIFVLPSHHEGMPTVLLEAMASGTPVISTAVGGASEVVVHGENGLLVPPHEPTLLANALLSLLTEPALRNRLGQNAYCTVVEKFSWQAICRRYLACYEQALDGGRA